MQGWLRVNPVSTHLSKEANEPQGKLLPYGVNRFVELTPLAAALWRRLDKLLSIGKQVRALPSVTIDLMLTRTEDNHDFFRDVTLAFYRQAHSRHPKFPLISRVKYGLAVCRLAQHEKSYFDRLEPTGKRNIRKAIRLGYRFAPISYNHHLPDIDHIHQSTRVRQGRAMDEHLLRNAMPHANPASRNKYHDYPYFGVFRGDRLVAYAGCLVAGQLCSIEHIYGHAQFQQNGIVPLLLSSTADYLQAHYPHVSYYTYGTYYGATPSMQRFKRKFLFEPCRVNWRLGR